MMMSVTEWKVDFKRPPFWPPFSKPLFLPAQLIYRLLQHARLGCLKNANDFNGGYLTDVIVNHFANNISDRDRLFMQCYVAKNRSGRMGKFNTVFCKTYNRFEEARFHPDLVEQYEMSDEEESKPRGKSGRDGWRSVKL